MKNIIKAGLATVLVTGAIGLGNEAKADPSDCEIECRYWKEKAQEIKDNPNFTTTERAYYYKRFNDKAELERSLTKLKKAWKEINW